MKIEPYELTPKQTAHAYNLFRDEPTIRVGSISAVRISFDREYPNGYVCVFRTLLSDFRDIYWCDFVLFEITDERDGEVRYDCMGAKSFTELVDGDADADGFAKWDGCREVRSSAHVCSDSNLRDFLNALAATVMQASRLAGYEGDDKR